ncbi:DUF192 domain-containing protein [Methylocapsa sp. D3K7]|uniref:DUF192 domain-containing protein n=1 Tax=Methylocapsa sp. D3K7 TaxID=3041435 RepID=UPI00244EA40C|nr:DUF192 domain-containing protein [Methylocapsa sp. D3K7]WGJ14887.1 DUF192 domain-containing protein [Methylocapsa sp. D3K7]
MQAFNVARQIVVFTVLCAAFLIFNTAAGLAEDTPSRPDSGLEKLVIDTASGSHEFSVEVMRTGPQRERGLMFRRYLPQDRGMLFDFGIERPIMMWMKNTYLPLDMIFIGRTGKVSGIAQDAEPLSPKIIPSGAPAYGVLEVNAGTAARIDLKIGDRVRHPMFGK